MIAKEIYGNLDLPDIDAEKERVTSILNQVVTVKLSQDWGGNDLSLMKNGYHPSHFKVQVHKT